jgi:RimJ/RimL family protein N-acetyltransferase
MPGASGDSASKRCAIGGSVALAVPGPHDSWGHELALLRDELHALDVDIGAARAASARGRASKLSFKHDQPPRAVHGEPVALADGARIVVRPIEPDDAGEFRRGLRHLSALTAFRRFRASVAEVEPEELARLTRIDHVRHEAIIAQDPEAGTVIGVARYVCDPADPEQAEVTYVVADEWQMRGVGSVLIDRLAARARAAGVQRFIATSIAGDAFARRLLGRVADPVAEHDEDGLIVTTARLRDR